MTLINQITLNDIKYDLLKIIEPYDHQMEKSPKIDPVRRLFKSYLSDLQKDKQIHDFSIETSFNRENCTTYGVNVQLLHNRAPKKLKIHVGHFVYPWIKR